MNYLWCAVASGNGGGGEGSVYVCIVLNSVSKEVAISTNTSLPAKIPRLAPPAKEYERKIIGGQLIYSGNMLPNIPLLPYAQMICRENYRVKKAVPEAASEGMKMELLLYSCTRKMGNTNMKMSDVVRLSGSVLRTSAHTHTPSTAHTHMHAHPPHGHTLPCLYVVHV